MKALVEWGEYTKNIKKSPATTTETPHITINFLYGWLPVFALIENKPIIKNIKENTK